MSKLRLVKVHVQPFYVLDDGENLVEIQGPAAASVTPEDWPAYATTKFLEAEAEIARAIAETEEPAPTPPTPNRAQRRAAGARKQ